MLRCNAEALDERRQRGPERETRGLQARQLGGIAAQIAWKQAVPIAGKVTVGEKQSEIPRSCEEPTRRG